MAEIGPTRWMPQFPVSVAVEGADAGRRMADLGVDCAMLCTMIYSPYRLVLPRYPDKGIYSLEEGLYYFKPDASRFADLPVKPEPSRDFAEKDLLAETVAGARSAGIEAAAWVTIFASGRIAKAHPDWAVQNLYGSRDRLFLDFDHPEVREYSMRLCEQIVQRYDVDEIMLDKFPQTCLEINSFAGRMDPVLRTLGTLNFSAHAVAAAKRAGIDLEAHRADALKLAAGALAMPEHLINARADELIGDTEIPLLLVDHPWLVEVLNQRMQSIREFLTELRQRLDAVRPGLRLSMAFVPPAKIGHDAASPRAWLAGQSYRAYRDADVDLIHCVVHWDAASVEYDTRRAVAALAGSPIKTCTHVKAYGSTAPAELPSLVGAAERAGAHGTGLFCYDLMSDAMLEAVGALA